MNVYLSKDNNGKIVYNERTRYIIDIIADTDGYLHITKFTRNNDIIIPIEEKDIPSGMDSIREILTEYSKLSFIPYSEVDDFNVVVILSEV